jgi:hypothetical protein
MGALPAVRFRSRVGRNSEAGGPVREAIPAAQAGASRPSSALKDIINLAIGEGRLTFPTFRSAEEADKACSQAFLIACLAFPDGENAPAFRFERILIFPVSRFIAFEFGQPIAQIRFWNMRNPAVMRMPKAPVNENHLAARNERQIWIARKVFPMQAESEAQSMGKAPHRKFGFHTLAPDRTHIGAAVH